MAHVSTCLEKYEDDEIITWAGYNASRMSDETIKPKALIGVLHLFSDKAATPAIMKHAMQLTMEDTQFLNQGQTTVLGCDQSLYAIAKQLQ